jgi:hypothetical protein
MILVMSTTIIIMLVLLDTNDTTGNANNNNNNNNNNAGPAGPTTVERYSLIYYETGNNFIKPGPAVFSIPKDIKR